MIAPSNALPPFLAERIATHRYPLAFRTPYAEWSREIRDIWKGGLPPSGVSHTQILQSTDNRRLMRFRYATGDTGEAVFMTPVGDGPHPAILLMHDHGGAFDIGWQKMVAGEAGQSHVARHYDGRFIANMLVDLGFAVLVCDALGWGSRFAGGYEQQQALASQATQAGWSLAGIVAADDLAAFDWLARQPEIEPSRIGTFGFSFGGFRAWQLAALEPGAAACVSLSWAGTRQGMLGPGATLLKGQSAFYTLHPHLAALADFPDMAALATDRPLFMRSGSDDRHFPADSAQQFFSALEKVGDDHPDTGLFEGTHHCPVEIQDSSFAFLNKHLI